MGRGMSDTPRTDAVTEIRDPESDAGHVVDADFARQLERELALVIRNLAEAENCLRGVRAKIGMDFGRVPALGAVGICMHHGAYTTQYCQQCLAGL